MSALKKIAGFAMDCGYRGMTSEATFKMLSEAFPSFMASISDADSDALYNFWMEGYIDCPDSEHEPEDRY